SMAQDVNGHVWIAGLHGGLARAVPSADGFRLRPVQGADPVLATAYAIPREGGGVWVGTRHGLCEVDPVRGFLRTITTRQGLPSLNVRPLLVDRSGNLWVAFPREGIARLAARGLGSFGRADGLEQPRIGTLLKTHSGDLVAVGGDTVLYRRERERFVPIHPSLPRGIVDPGWGWRRWVLEGRRGDWWIPTGDGIVRYSGLKRVDDLARARPVAVYTVGNGLPSNHVFRLFEDSLGDIWISVLGN